jgi:NAD(P)-dependent dehydrogenase (short-subunit alcohol dehydrogenase family)
VALDERMVAGSPDRVDLEQGWNIMPGNEVHATRTDPRSEDGDPAGAVTNGQADRAEPNRDDDPITQELELPPLPVFKPLPAFASRPVASPTGSPRPGRHAAPAPDRELIAEHDPAGQPGRPGRPAGLTVLLLGATGSVGSALAAALAAAGHRLVLHYGNDTAAAADLLASLDGDHHQARGTDLADPAAVAELIAGIDDEVGGIDVVINAVADRTPTATIDSGRRAWADSWSSVLSVDVLGTAAVAHAAAAVFRARRRGGRIILVPAHGRPNDGPADLAREAAAAAVAALGRGLARELAPHGIGVLTVAAGTAAASGWAPEDLAAAVAWLVSGPTAALPGAVFTVVG